MLPEHIEFGFNSDQLTPPAKQALNQVGSLLALRFRDHRIELQGNTDDIGTADYNMTLSARRAGQVKEFLEDNFAIPSSRLKTVAMGKSNPAMPNDSDESRACNRRVDFIISRPESEP